VGIALKQPNPNLTLGKATFRAAEKLGLTQSDVAEIIGRNRSSISRNGIDPDSKSGELAAMLVRCYRSLYALTGGKNEDMQHWIHTPNHAFAEQKPAELAKRVEGLASMLRYLDAMRG